MVTYIMPIFAIVAGVIVLHEHLTWYQPVGAVIVLAGVAVSQGVISSVRSRKQPKIAAEPEPAPVP
jgi:threonine/homoserine efflux transporter RhtA